MYSGTIITFLAWQTIIALARFVPEAKQELATQDAISQNDNSELKKEPIKIQMKYHGYDDLTDLLDQIANNYPDLVKLYSIGSSVEGRQLWVALISGDVRSEEKLLKPHVKLVANMHGNEAIGRELLLQLLVYMVNSYPRNDRIRSILDTTYVHILFSMNPDGFELSKEGTCLRGKGRENANGFDLNRNFPDFFAPKNYKPSEEQPETRAVRHWLDQRSFVLSGNLHGGALVASYPFDNNQASDANNQTGPQKSITPDDDVFKYLAETYSFNHKTMYLGEACPFDSEGFKNGTTNGAEWYLLEGGMQDYNYYWVGCMEITLEISCCKHPKSIELPSYWDQNKEALLAFISQAHRGVRGIITDDLGQPMPDAVLKIKGRDFGFRASKRGEFWRILLPGEYILTVSAPGFISQERSFIVEEDQHTLLNVKLYPFN